MKTIQISEFKATCIAVLKEVDRSGEAVTVTLRGRPLARIEPLPSGADGKQLGTLGGCMTIGVDLVAADTAVDWEPAG